MPTNLVFNNSGTTTAPGNTNYSILQAGAPKWLTSPAP
jgi:hypothetical protein